MKVHLEWLLWGWISCLPFSSLGPLHPFPPCSMAWEADLHRLYQRGSFPSEITEFNYPAPFLWVLSLAHCVPWLKIAVPLKVVLSTWLAPSVFGKFVFPLFLWILQLSFMIILYPGTPFFVVALLNPPSFVLTGVCYLSCWDRDYDRSLYTLLTG